MSGSVHQVANTGVLSNGLWHLLHSAADMRTLLAEISGEVQAWPGVSHRADIMGPSDDARDYRPEQTTVAAALIVPAGDLWHLQWLTLFMVWTLPTLQHALRSSSPLPVCKTFFDSFDATMSTLVFGNSGDAAAVAHLPVGVVTRVLRLLKRSYHAHTMENGNEMSTLTT
jgi:hypothetical protein